MGVCFMLLSPHVTAFDNAACSQANWSYRLLFIAAFSCVSLIPDEFHVVFEYQLLRANFPSALCTLSYHHVFFF